MDAELQKSIREFNPSDVATHGLWHRLARVHPLHEIVDSIPLSEMAVGQLLQHSGKVLAEIGKKIKAIKPIKLDHAIHRNASHTTTIEDNMGAPELFQKLSELFSQCGQEFHEEFTPQITAQFYGSFDSGYDGDHVFRDLEIRLDIYNARPETSEEEAERLKKEKIAKEKAKKAKQQKAKKQQLEKEQLELAEYERLRKKFGEK